MIRTKAYGFLQASRVGCIHTSAPHVHSYSCTRVCIYIYMYHMHAPCYVGITGYTGDLESCRVIVGYKDMQGYVGLSIVEM